MRIKSFNTLRATLADEIDNAEICAIGLTSSLQLFDPKLEGLYSKGLATDALERLEAHVKGIRKAYTALVSMQLRCHSWQVECTALTTYQRQTVDLTLDSCDTDVEARLTVDCWLLCHGFADRDPVTKADLGSHSVEFQVVFQDREVTG